MLVCLFLNCLSEALRFLKIWFALKEIVPRFWKTYGLRAVLFRVVLALTDLCLGLCLCVPVCGMCRLCANCIQRACALFFILFFLMLSTLPLQHWGIQWNFIFSCRDTKMHRKHIFLKSSSVVILLRQIFVEKWYPSISSQISNKLLIGFLSFCLVWLPAPIFMHY